MKKAHLVATPSGAGGKREVTAGIKLKLSTFKPLAIVTKGTDSLPCDTGPASGAQFADAAPSAG